MRRDKRRTREEIRLAILRVERRRPKRIRSADCRMTISAVAREAGISPASIHNTYPDIAEAIRAKAAKAGGPTFHAQRLERKRLAELLRLARERLKATERDFRRLASENARLVTENAVLKAKYASRNVLNFRPSTVSEA